MCGWRCECDPLTDGDAVGSVALTVSRVLCVVLSMRPPLQLHTYLTRCLLYSPASVHARRRGGQEEAILRPPARLDAQAHAARLLELVELQLAAAIRAWVRPRTVKGRQQGRGPLRGPCGPRSVLRPSGAQRAAVRKHQGRKGPQVAGAAGAKATSFWSVLRGRGLTSTECHAIVCSSSGCMAL